MKVLFLDIDGVLNSKKWFETHHGPVGSDHLDPDAIAVLNKIVEQTGVKVVVSSTWRTIFERDELQALLRFRGFRGSIFGTTPSFSSIRGKEIKEWLRCYPEKVDSFVIIDDDDDMEDFTPRLCLTAWEYGLKDYHIPVVVDILKRPYEPSPEFYLL